MQKGARQLTRQILQLSYARSESTSFSRSRRFVSSTARRRNSVPDVDSSPGNDPARKASTLTRPEHAVVSAFDLFSIGVGPSSSHTVGPMRAGKIFVEDLRDMGIIDKVSRLKCGLYGSLAATGKGHMTPQAVMMGLEASDPETVDPHTIGSRYDDILSQKVLQLGGTRQIKFDMDKDMLWRNEPLPAHPNGMRFSVYNHEGTLLAVNTYYSTGGGFVVNERTQVDENLYYRAVHKEEAPLARRDQAHGLDILIALPAPSSGDAPPADSEPASSSSTPTSTQPPYLFRDAQMLLRMSRTHNLTIAQLVHDNERAFRSSDEISAQLLNIWAVMDESIRDGVSSVEETLPGQLAVRRRAASLYRRLFKGFYPALNPSNRPALPSASSSPSSSFPRLGDASDAKPPASAHHTASSSSRKDNATLARSNRSRAPLVVGSFDHDLQPVPWKKTVFPGIDFLSCYAIAVNEVNASGGRVVTAPTNGAAGVIPAVLKYFVEFISDDVERDVKTFLLTAAAIGMLFKRGATISAAEGGCMAEVGVASAMAAGGYVAVMGGTPSQILQAAEIGIEHHLGLTCDPPFGLVQVPCIERNSLGAVKAVTAAQLALAGDGVHSVSLDEAIEAMRLTARDMHNHYKETSMSGLATTFRIPLSSPAC